MLPILARMPGPNAYGIAFVVVICGFVVLGVAFQLIAAWYGRKVKARDRRNDPEAKP